MATSILVEPTITKLSPAAKGSVIICGSHGGRYPGYAAAKAHVRAVIFNDAGVGLQEAGIGSLAYLNALGIGAATVSHMSCRIGDADDMRSRGTISHVNRVAAAVGVEIGMACQKAAELLRGVTHIVSAPALLGESRSVVDTQNGLRRIVLIDSAALVDKRSDVGQIVVTGSHGGLVGGDPIMALQVDGFAAVYNDAGGGADGAGLTRLPALDARGIAALTVSSASARIGEARSTFNHGIVSAINDIARQLGARAGLPVRSLLEQWARLR